MNKAIYEIMFVLEGLCFFLFQYDLGNRFSIALLGTGPR